jgi:hypothetical protein
VDEVVPFEQQRLTHDPGKRVGETVPEVEPSGTPAALAEITVGVASDPGLLLAYRLD